MAENVPIMSIIFNSSVGIFGASRNLVSLRCMKLFAPLPYRIIDGIKFRHPLRSSAFPLGSSDEE